MNPAILWWTLLLVASGVAACGGRVVDSTPPDADRPLVGIAIEGPRVITLNPQQSVSLLVRGQTDEGSVLVSDTAISWQAATPSRLSVDTEGNVVAAGPLGLDWVHARVGAFHDSVAVWVQPPASVPTPFKITLSFAEGVPEYVRAMMQRAARRWEQVIRDQLPPVSVSTLPQHCPELSEADPAILSGVERGVRIAVVISDGFPPGTYVGAVGGPCVMRPLPYPTTAIGVIILNQDHLDIGIPPYELYYLAHHEMGHTLGVAGVVQGLQPSWAPQPPEWFYFGPLALHGWKLAGGDPVTSLQTLGAHWPVGVRDIMDAEGWRDDPITEVTVGGLMDLGYPAAWYGAGPI